MKHQVRTLPSQLRPQGKGDVSLLRLPIGVAGTYEGKGPLARASPFIACIV